MKNGNRLNRRSFLKKSVATAAVATISGGIVTDVLAQTSSGPGNKWPGRVVINFNTNAVKDTNAVEDVAKKMVDDAIMLLTGKSTVGEAWKEIFPSTLSLQSKIAIKINILNNGKPAPHPFTVMGITEGLQKMDFGGTKFPAANITIYDMNNGNSMDSAGYTAQRFPGIARVKDSANAYGDGALNNRKYSRILHDSNFLINVFSPRGHNVGSTFTLGFKSHFGTYENAPGLHDNATSNLTEINCNGPVYKKTVLSFCSGLFGMNEGNGPKGNIGNYSVYSKAIDATSKNTCPTTIIMSTDPVSCEMQAIKMMRMNQNSKNYGVNSMPDYLKNASGVGNAKYNIGIIDETRMDIRRIINDVVISTGNKKSPAFLNLVNSEIHVTRLHGAHCTFIEYVLPENYTGRDAFIEIYNLNGTQVFKTIQRVCGIRNHLSWDEKDGNGRSVASGTYLVNLLSGKTNLSTKLSVIH